MSGRCHLWEVNYCDFFFFICHQVKFVEVAMYKSMLSKHNNLLNKLVINLFWVSQALNINHRVGFDQTHANRMSIAIVGNRSSEATFVQSTHKCKLFETRNSWHIKPSTRASLQIVSIVFDRTKWSSSQSRELDNDRFTIVNWFSFFVNFVSTITNIDVWLFTNANLAQKSFNVSALHESV